MGQHWGGSRTKASEINAQQSEAFLKAKGGCTNRCRLGRKYFKIIKPDFLVSYWARWPKLKKI